MICPYCNTPNDPGFQYCLKCGRPLTAGAPAPVNLPAAPRGLWIETIRLVIMLFALWITRAILIGLAFVRDIRFTNFPLSITTIISIIIYLAIVVLLIAYAVAFPRLWRASFPRYGSAAQVITAVIYLFLLSQIYRAAQPLVSQLIVDPEAMTLLQVLLLIFALVLVLRALILLNRELPRWLSQIAADAQPPAVEPAPVQPPPAAQPGINPSPAA